MEFITNISTAILAFFASFLPFWWGETASIPNSTENIEISKSVKNSNGDGLFDVDDEYFAVSRKWQDKDGDGIVDEGEMRTILAEDGSYQKVREEIVGNVIIFEKLVIDEVLKIEDLSDGSLFGKNSVTGTFWKWIQINSDTYKVWNINTVIPTVGSQDQLDPLDPYWRNYIAATAVYRDKNDKVWEPRKSRFYYQIAWEGTIKNERAVIMYWSYIRESSNDVSSLISAKGDDVPVLSGDDLKEKSLY